MALECSYTKYKMVQWQWYRYVATETCTIYKQHALQFITRQLSSFACFGPGQFIAFGLIQPKQM